jgi:hypothetical protein
MRFSYITLTLFAFNVASPVDRAHGMYLRALISFPIADRQGRCFCVILRPQSNYAMTVILTQSQIKSNKIINVAKRCVVQFFK